MKEYLNREDKQAVLQAAAFMLHMRDLGQDSRFHPYRKNANMAATWAEKWVGEVLADYEEEAEELMRLARSVEIQLAPKAAARTGREMVILPQDAVDRITGAALSDCALCFKEGKEIRKCQMRKDLSAAGVAARGRGECPYRMI